MVEKMTCTVKDLVTDKSVNYTLKTGKAVVVRVDDVTALVIRKSVLHDGIKVHWWSDAVPKMEIAYQDR